MEIPKNENIDTGRIAITGGNGFVGRAVVTQLLDAGYRQIVVIARHASADVAHIDGVSFVAGDLTISSDACRALAGCDAVVHLVGIIRPTSRQSFYDAHVAATENTVFAMRENGINVCFTCLHWERALVPFRTTTKPNGPLSRSS